MKISCTIYHAQSNMIYSHSGQIKLCTKVHCFAILKTNIVFVSLEGLPLNTWKAYIHTLLEECYFISVKTSYSKVLIIITMTTFSLTIFSIIRMNTTHYETYFTLRWRDKGNCVSKYDKLLARCEIQCCNVSTWHIISTIYLLYYLFVKKYRK